MRRLIGELRLGEARRRARRVPDQRGVAEPREGRRRLPVVVPGWHVVAVEVRAVAEPGNGQGAVRAGLRPDEHVRVRVVAIDLVGGPPGHLRVTDHVEHDVVRSRAA